MDSRQPPKQEQTELQEMLAMLQGSSIYKYFDKKLESREGTTFLGLFSFFDSFLVFIPMEPIVALYAIKRPEKSILSITAFTTFMNVLGYVTVFYLGLLGSSYILDIVEKYFGALPVDRVSGLLEQGIIPLTAISGFFSFPVPLTIFSFTSGVLAIAILPFIVGVAIGKAGRYSISAYAGRYYGVAFLEKILQHTALFYFVLAIAAVLLWFKFV